VSVYSYRQKIRYKHRYIRKIISDYTIKNYAKENKERDAARKAKSEKVLEYLQRFYPWLKCHNDKYFLKRVLFGLHWGEMCNFDEYENTIFVNVHAEGIATEEFAEFLSSVFEDKKIDITITEYRERY